MMGQHQIPDDIIVLKERQGYVPTDEEIVNYANWLGLVDGEDDDLVWIPRKAMCSSLPKPWKPCKARDTGEVRPVCPRCPQHSCPPPSTAGPAGLTSAAGWAHGPHGRLQWAAQGAIPDPPPFLSSSPLPLSSHTAPLVASTPLRRGRSSTSTPPRASPSGTTPRTTTGPTSSPSAKTRRSVSSRAGNRVRFSPRTEGVAGRGGGGTRAERGSGRPQAQAHAIPLSLPLPRGLVLVCL